MSKYNVGDKFTIEIKELINGSNDKMFYKSDCCSIIFGEEQLDKLQKYNGSTISEDTLEMVRMKALNEGRNEVWELARKIYEMKSKEFDEVFRDVHYVDVFYHFTPQEALAKLEAYEKEQNEIKVGDIVYNDDTMEEGVVTHIDNDEVFMLYDDGSCGNTYGNLTKTGKHIDIQSVLKQIGSDADELS